MSALAHIESCCLHKYQLISEYLWRTYDLPWGFRKIILEAKIRQMREENEDKDKDSSLFGKMSFSCPWKEKYQTRNI